MPGRTSPQQIILFGMGGVISIALFNIAGQLIGLMGNISLGLSAFWLGTILVIPRLWDAVSDPIMGYITDNTRTRWGRRRPYILLGGISVALSFVMMWWVPGGNEVRAWFPCAEAFRWFQLSYILVSLLAFFTACTIFEIPHGALGLELAAEPHERTRLFSAKSFFGNLFAMGTPWLFALAGTEAFRGPGGTEMDGMRYVSLLVAAILIPASFWWFLQLREASPLLHTAHASGMKRNAFWSDMAHTARNRNFLLLVAVVFTLAMGFNFVGLLNYYISIFYLFGGDKIAAGPLLGINGTIWAVTGLLAVFPLNWISPRAGKRNTLIAAIGLMCIAQLTKIVCYDPEYPYLVIIPTILLSAGMLFFFTLGSSMLGDVCDEEEWRTGVRAEGRYYSVYWWFIKIGTALASFVMGLLIVFSRFDEAQVTKVDALRTHMAEIRIGLQNWNAWAEGPLPTDREGLAAARSQIEQELTKATQRAQDLSLRIANAEAPLPALPETIAIAAGSAGQKSRLEMLRTLESQSPEEIRSLQREAYVLSLGLEIDSARFSALELKTHLAQRPDAAGAYVQGLIQSANAMQKELLSFRQKMEDSPLPPPLDTSFLTESSDALLRLARQSPDSLLRMRIIEISLPLFLSLVSLLFALKYPLTELRCREIQHALAQRKLNCS
jgi:GPH family glycoside/pentoside/hexuronide:cation symporter